MWCKRFGTEARSIACSGSRPADEQVLEAVKMCSNTNNGIYITLGVVRRRVKRKKNLRIGLHGPTLSRDLSDS
jgi:hypothetical protein